MKEIKGILCISLFSIFIFSLSYATQPSIPSLKMEVSIIHDGNWEVGKETQVTFKFKPLQEVPHKTEHPDEAVVKFDSSMVLVSGERGWSGFLEKNKEYQITVVLKPTKGGKFGIRGAVNSSLLKIYTDEEIRKMEEEFYKRIEQSPELKKKGQKPLYPKKSFYYHNGASTVVEVRGEIPASDKWRYPTSRPAPTIPLDSILKIKKEELKRIPSKDSGKGEKLKNSSAFAISGRFRY